MHERKVTMSKTYQERLIAGLTAMGYKPIEHKSGLYKAFIRNGPKMFVGPNGALRTGRSASNSHSVGDPSQQTGFYSMVLARGDATLATAAKPQNLAALAKEFCQ